MKFSYENPLPSYQLLSEQDLKTVHTATLYLMKNTGVRVYRRGSEGNLPRSRMHHRRGHRFDPFSGGAGE